MVQNHRGEAQAYEKRALDALQRGNVAVAHVLATLAQARAALAVWDAVDDVRIRLESLDDTVESVVRNLGEIAERMP